MIGYANIGDSSICVGKAISTDLPDVEYTPYKQTETKNRRPHISEIEVYSFPQKWGSTALGFGGMGAASITSSQTTIIKYRHRYASVYFGTEFAYTVNINQAFLNDMSNYSMKSCKEAIKDYDVIKLFENNFC